MVGSVASEKLNKYDQKLSRILHSAAEVFACEGYDRASIRTVAQEAQVSVAGLYYYIRSKDELLFLIQYHVFDELIAKYQTDSAAVSCPKERLKLFVSSHVERFLDHMADLVVCSREIDRLKGDFRKEIEEKHREYFGLALHIYDDLSEEFGVGQVNPRTAALAMFGSMNWIFTWYRPESNPSPAELAEDFVRLYLQGFLPRAEQTPG